MGYKYYMCACLDLCMGRWVGPRTNPTVIKKNVILGRSNQETTAAVTTEDIWKFPGLCPAVAGPFLYSFHTSCKSLFLFITGNFSLSPF